MTLPYYEIHKGNGPPLLLVHGILSSRAQWQQNLEALKKVCQPVVVELFGHGRSDAPADETLYHPDHYIEAFEQIRLKLGAEKWFVLGYSLGAGLTIRYCIKHPDKVYAQAFTNSTSAFADEDVTSQYRMNGAAIVARYESEGMSAVESIPVHPKNAKRLPEAVKAALLADCALLDPGGVARTIVYTNGNSSVRNIVSRNSTPALLICGELETRFEPHKSFAMSNMPQLEVTNLPAGHAVNAETPEGFNTAITQFISHHSPVIAKTTPRDSPRNKTQ
jgi:pimeloyl-ACP methyl ester carboxylesterase